MKEGETKIQKVNKKSSNYFLFPTLSVEPAPLRTNPVI
jgi:hypothetical protein